MVAHTQDWLLGSERFKSLVLRAFRRRYDAVVEEAAASAASLQTFDILDYYVDANARQLLQFAGLHALSVQLTAEEALAPSQLLPCVSRVLLQTEEKNSGRYLEAVASALAGSMHAALLPVDAALLSRLAAVPFSTPSDTDLPALSTEELSGGSGGKDGGRAPAGARLRLAWEALRRSVHARAAPTVLYLRQADRLLCRSMEAYEAFTEAWGSPELLALEGGSSRAPVVMLAGCCLVETGAGVTVGRPKQDGGGSAEAGSGSGSGGEEDGEGDVAPKPSKGLFKGLFGGDDLGLFDDDSGLGALLRELEAPIDDKPNPRRVLPKLFPTRVKLQPPPSGPAALRHQQRMARDALEAAEEENYRAARATAVSAGVTLPPKSSGLYACSNTLSKADWAKALAWAVTMQLVQREQQCGRGQRGQQQGPAGAEAAGDLLMLSPSLMQQHQDARQGREEEEGEKEASEKSRDTGAQPSCAAAGREGAGACLAGPPSAASPVSLRGSLVTSTYSSNGLGAQRALEEPLPLPPAAPQESGFSIGSAAGTSAPVRGAAGLLGEALRLVVPATLPHLLGFLSAQLQSLAPSALQPLVAPVLGVAAWLAQWLGGTAAMPPPAEGEGEAYKGAPRQQPAAAVGSDIRSTLGADADLQLSAEAAQAALGAGAGENRSSGGGGGGGGGGKEGGGGDSLGGEMQLSPRAVQYGLAMVRRSGGALKQGVRAANSYEKKLLAEVLSPEDCGGGFAEVGALEEAKRALREAVQLPLKHPHLFGGALARPSKGVLMFGPPGTGKTLLARAAAAECGASFLGINPSSVASKWFGDGVRFIRAAFTLAAKLSPCVIFVDEVDALLGKRNSVKEHEALREMKNEFMACWDGIRAGQGSRVMVLGATNRPFDIDEAVLRRFTDRVFVGLPNKAARRDILGVVLAGEVLAPDVDLARLAEITAGYSGSDLRQLCVQAAMRPVRQLLEEEGRASAEAQARTARHAKQQAATLPPGSEGGDAGGAAVPVTEGEPGRLDGAAAAGGDGGGDGGGGGSRVRADSERAAASEASGFEGLQEEGERGASKECGGLGLVPSSEGRITPYAPQQLGQLLAAAEGIAGEAGSRREELRPTSMQDFEEARKEVTATVDPDSHAIQELNEWNTRFGTIGSKRGVENKRLSYYL